MARKNEIAHTGRIIEIDKDFTTVEITVSSACSSCHAKGLCGMSEDEDKVIMVPTDPYTLREVGDEVMVKTKMTMGLKAVWISYVVPLVILLILILSLKLNVFFKCGRKDFAAVFSRFACGFCIRLRHRVIAEFI